MGGKKNTVVTFANLLIFYNHCDWRSRPNQNMKNEAFPVLFCFNADIYPKLYFTKIIHAHYGQKRIL